MQQLIANSLIAASLYSAIGLSFWLIYRSAGFFHFAHGATITFGAYACYCAVSLDVPLFWSVILGIGFSACLGALMQVGVFQPLTRRGGGPLVLLLVSLGLYVVIENVLAMIFGYAPKSLKSGPVLEGFNFLNARLTAPQILMIGFAVATFFFVWLVLHFSRAGLKLRAVGSDPDLANILGIDAENVALGALVIGSGIAGLFGILFALDLDLSPGIGLHPLMMGIVAVIIGGLDSIVGIVMGALFLALSQNLGVWFISSQWQDAIAFSILLGFLLFRPQGILGKSNLKTSLT